MLVVTLPRSAQKNPALFAKRAKKEGAEILEVRSDLTPRLKKFSSSLPLLVSIRGTDIGLVQRLQPTYVDCDIGRTLFPAKASSAKLIVSFHDYKRTPSLSVLLKTVQKMCAKKPWMVKIATQIRSFDDLRTLADLQAHLRKIKIRSTVLGMGEKGHLSRVLSPYTNTFTYACFTQGAAAAPGQLPLNFYALTKGRKTPRILGILGGPSVVHSKSPWIHNALFQRHNVDALYSLFPGEKFTKDVSVLTALGVVGMSVTTPFKHDAYRVSVQRDTVSKELRVANTLVSFPSPRGRGVRGEGEWHAFNTDGEGILKGYPVLASAKTVFILGAGGVVPSVIRACRSANPSVSITVCARNVLKATKELRSLSVNVMSLRRVKQYAADLVFCAVSQDAKLPLPLPVGRKTAIDLRYGKETRFQKDARRAGFRVYDGVPMLLHQALKQFEYFTGKKPDSGDTAFLQKLFRDNFRHSPGEPRK